ncbi:hypothetical protein BDV93DRAFT_514237 [Ceratobasidium sp. AG-I]|nr:hypothetical protein BDV93DRAFT_514237 [Ceratobasidium sp. AG-I]
MSTTPDAQLPRPVEPRLAIEATDVISLSKEHDVSMAGSSGEAESSNSVIYIADDPSKEANSSNHGSRESQSDFAVLMPDPVLGPQLLDDPDLPMALDTSIPEDSDVPPASGLLEDDTTKTTNESTEESLVNIGDTNCNVASVVPKPGKSSGSIFALEKANLILIQQYQLQKLGDLPKVDNDVDDDDDDDEASTDSDSIASLDLPEPIQKKTWRRTECFIDFTPQEEKEARDFERRQWSLKKIGSKYKNAKGKSSISIESPRVDDLTQVDTFVKEVPQIPEQASAARTGLQEIPSSYKKVQYLTTLQADDLSQDDLCRMFATQNIVILPEQSTPEAKRSRFKDSNGHLTLAKLTDPKTRVEVHDEVIDHIYDEAGHVLNVLSLHDEAKSLGQPEPVIALSSDVYAFNSTASLLQTWSHFPHRQSSWLLLGGPGAISCDHVDAAGYCTWVKITAGAGKLWLICLGPKDPHDDVHNNTAAWVDDCWAEHSSDPEFLVENYYWQSSTLNRTMHARCLEHYHKDTLTNKVLPESWIVVEAGASPYPLDDLASLILMCSTQDSFMSTDEEEPDQSYQPLRSILDSLQEKLGHWNTSISQHWSEVHRCYIPPGKAVEAILAGPSFSTKMEEDVSVTDDSENSGSSDSDYVLED